MSKYFEQEGAKTLLETMSNNERPFGLLQFNRDLWKLAQDEGFKFERFSHLGITRNPVWVEDDTPVTEWKFTDTYRIK